MPIPFSSVVGYHMNPMTCGVAKFNAELAKRLNVPFVSMRHQNRMGSFPLYSLKWSEVQDWPGIVPWTNYGVFWHDEGESVVTANARTVFYADPSLGSPGLFCPSLIPEKKTPLRLFSFGMAHKLQAKHYARIRELLDRESWPFHLRVSVGLHEGTSLDEATKHFDALYEVMGPENVTILGCLSDDAVREELRSADYVLAFFEKGLRANNTTVHAAFVAGKRVFSNCDEHTTSQMRSLVHDINSVLRIAPGRSYLFSWEHLIDEMGRICDRSKSAIAS